MKEWENAKPINNLEEFISEMRGFDNYYFRGENTSYISRSASAYRPIGESGFTHKYYDYKIMAKEFYRKTANHLSELERENFYPYAQHYGLPTPLIDVTNTPSTALYFASELTNKENDLGYIYCYSLEKSIDISPLFTNNWDRDIVIDFIKEDDDIWLLFINELGRIKKYYPDYFNNIFLNLMSWCTEFFTDHRLHLDEYIMNNKDKSYFKIMNWFSSKQIQVDLDSISINTKVSDINKDKISTLISLVYRHEDFKEFNNNGKYNSQNDVSPTFEVIPYLYVLKNYLEFFNNEVDAWLIHYLPSFPNLIIYPTILFDRLLAQDGFFIYQPSMYKKEHSYNSQEMIHPKVIADRVFEINNKRDIIRDLKIFGVDDFSLFLDSEHLATQIQNNPKHLIEVQKEF